MKEKLARGRRLERLGKGETSMLVLLVGASAVPSKLVVRNGDAQGDFQWPDGVEVLDAKDGGKPLRWCVGDIVTRGKGGRPGDRRGEKTPTKPRQRGRESPRGCESARTSWRSPTRGERGGTGDGR